ncbi:Mannan endo-1,4-beta-mannosidase 1 [Acorus calamus]|uniref:mannan endo-1,4-beta-mannosidase n=1 Tax=Acorus calamus TaxID=4465 RepID=A0AAV9F104_ACOCL|nr:Mannan endo-1,4-beta-mannosidase 1 [Acorus calamus]
MYKRQACIGVLVCLALQILFKHGVAAVDENQDFVKVRNTHFEVHGRPFYSNGFNAYWLMNLAADPNQRYLVTRAFQVATNPGMAVVRTWAFSEFGNDHLLRSPGNYNENIFRGLDFVIAEAKRNGVYLILSLVNNFGMNGGEKSRYVQWARDRGQYLDNDDEFFTNEVVRGFYRDHVKTVLTRVNTFTNVAYRDDPTIFAWELMNEPRTPNDLSGKGVQSWVAAMVPYVKSIDSNHLLEIGIEGFYGYSIPDRLQYNPGYQAGTDFIANNQVPGVDFATIHAYPDQWTPGADEQSQANFLNRWLQSHIQDATTILKKPVMMSEFGRSSKFGPYYTGQRDALFSTIYNTFYGCARSGGPCGGSLFWHLLLDGMESFGDGYEVILSRDASTANIILSQARQISGLNGPKAHNFTDGTVSHKSNTTKFMGSTN